MSIFDNFERTTDTHREVGISYFEFLNSSAGEQASVSRQEIDKWFSRFPEPQKTNLLSRLKARDDDSHNSAFFELLLHEFFHTVGLMVLEVEPEIASTGKTPDFLLRGSNGDEFYVEATNITGISKAEKSALKLVQTVINTLNELKSDKFHLKLNYRGIPGSVKGLKHLKSSAQAWLDSCTQVDFPPFEWVFNGMEITLKAYIERSKPGVALGVIVPEGRNVSPHLDLKRNIGKKSNKYKDVDIPIVLALNVMELGADHIDVFSAIFGTEIVKLYINEKGEEEAILDRIRDGVFVTDQPVNTRISGLLVFDGVGCWNVGTNKNATFYQNPLAKSPISRELFRVNAHVANFETKEMEFVEGDGLQSILF